MSIRRAFLALATVSAMGCAAGAPLQAPTAPSAQAAGPASSAPRLTRATPEIELLESRVGTWSVVMTMRPSPVATPLVVPGLLAERSIVGPYLQEVMRPAPGSSGPDFRRIDFLTFNPLQARWQYLSMDTRATVGLMFAQGIGPERGNEITVYFTDFPAPPELGAETGGRFMRARHVFTRDSGDHEFSRQYWSMDGGPEWLGVQYEYTRRGPT